MTRRLWTILGMLACFSAAAADWATVPTGDGNQHFYDKSKVFVTGDEVIYWRRVVFSSPHPVRGGFARSAMYRERIQCKQHRVTTFGYLLYSADGSVLENVYTPDAEANAIVPETVGDRFERVMCAMAAAEQPATSPPKDPKKTESGDELRQEIERLEAQLKRLRERVGDKPN